MDNPFQPLNDANPFDFTKPDRPGATMHNERPWIVHQTDEGYPEVLMGQMGDTHKDLRDYHDVGDELLRGYAPEGGEPFPEVGDEAYMPMVESHLENMADEEDWPTEHTAGVTDGHWGYLNGEVGFGNFHHQIMDALGRKQNLPENENQLIQNLALANAHPANTNHDVAWGSFHKNYPVFWRTNVDRNAIWDSVQNARRVVEPPKPALAGVKNITELDFAVTAAVDSGGSLVELHPGDELLSTDGDHTTLNEGEYGANVTGQGGEILGSVSVQVDGTKVIIHEHYVKPEAHGTDVWLKLYQWVRQHWPHERVFGDKSPADMFEGHHRDYLGDDQGWDETGIGDDSDENTGLDEHQITPAWYSKVVENERIHVVPDLGYLAGKDIVTDQVRTKGSVGIDPSTGHPAMYVSKEKGEPPGRAHGTLTQVNAFRKGAWKWGQKDLGYNKVMSVEHGPYHHYTMRVNFNGPVHLKEHHTEPHLRPTTYGELDFGQPISTIRLRGREHPLYDTIDVNPKRASERVGAGRFMQRAPWFIDMDGNPIVGNWGQFHQEIGSQNKSPYGPQTWAHKGDVDENGLVTVYHPSGDPSAMHPDPAPVFNQIAPHLRRSFGFGFRPELNTVDSTPRPSWDFSKVPEAPQMAYAGSVTPPKTTGGVWRGIRRALGMGGLEGDTELPGDYARVGAQPAEVNLYANNGVGHQLPDGSWASWSGWPDAYRFVSDGDNYLEQREQDLQSGHGFGHPGLNKAWSEMWPDRPKPNIALPRHSSGWHFPMKDGTRGVSMYRMPNQSDTSGVDNVMTHITSAHGAPAREIDPFGLDRDQVGAQHQYGNILMGGTPPATPESAENDTLDFGTPAPAPGAKRDGPSIG